MKIDIFFFFLVSFALATSEEYFETFFRKASSQAYSNLKVQAQWKLWLKYGTMKMECIEEVLQKKTTITELNVVGFDIERNKCHIQFPKGKGKTLGEIFTFLWGFDKLEMTATNTCGKHHDVELHLAGTGKYKFRIQRCNKEQLCLHFPGMRMLKYEDANKKLDSIIAALGKTPTAPSPAVSFVFMLTPTHPRSEPPSPNLSGKKNTSSATDKIVCLCKKKKIK